jgi:protein O-GlcNAc transferase
MNRRQRRVEARRNPDPSPTLFAAATAHHQAGRLAEAENLYRQLIAADPAHAEAHCNLGVALKAQGKRSEAIACYQRALALKPRYGQAHFNLGNCLLDEGRPAEAIAAFEQALASNPQDFVAHNNLGNLLKLQGRLDQAVVAFGLALSLNPQYGAAHYNLADALHRQGRLAEAVVSYRNALTLDPSYVEAHTNLGALLRELGQIGEARACFEAALALRPADADAHVNLGNAQADESRPDEAAQSFRRALTLQPDHAGAHYNLGNLHVEECALDEAVASYERALAQKPAYAQAHSNLLMVQHYMPSVSGAVRLAAARRFSRECEIADTAQDFDCDRTPARRLRIGYVSGDFQQHPTGFFLPSVLEAHDRAAVEIFCYANSRKADATTRRLLRAADHWRNIAGLSDSDAAALMRNDQIDIAVDLSGHTAKNRLLAFALRAAPVQVSWLGYFGTTGLRAMDYLIMDETAAPAREAGDYDEALVRLPYGRFCYAPPDDAPEVAEPPSLRLGRVTFGSFNNLAKINADVVGVWAQILTACPQSRLMLKWKSLDRQAARRRAVAAFAAAGVDERRLELRGFSPHAQMLAQYGEIDIALDPFPFGGGLTSCEALWMGAPLVTLYGDRPASRQSAGFLHLLELDECVARTPAEYVAQACALAADPARLTAMRRALRPAMAASPLCDGARFTPTLEAAYRNMWTRFCTGKPPVGFDVAPSASAA